MGIETIIEHFPWSEYSKKLAAKISQPKRMGTFSEKSTKGGGVRLVTGEEGIYEDGNMIRFYWLVDKENGQIIDAVYQVFGQSALIGAAEVAAEMLIGKNYDQAGRISGDLLDRQVRDHPNTPAFPKETSPHLNLVLGAIESAGEKCRDIPLPTSYEAPPVPMGIVLGDGVGYPGWDTLNQEGKMGVLEEVLDSDIRPYIALDGGGVELIHLIGNEVTIKYQGNCTSCFSAVGATLSYIQQVIQTKVHKSLKVIPSL